ncbi:MAG: type II toxin-antitoxin system PemK/MazF family toxin [Candidatus Saccharibacteria bacterium]|nr:type II toxin-antitoxin system PemK/MazF family toxin [Candidatus Saccharibacteria bacterium]
MKKFVKNYKEWMGVKTKINSKEKVGEINEGDVVWAAVGENVGVEIDGKSEKYSRPVIVLRKHSKSCFTGIPLTSQPHTGSWYTHFVFQGKKQTAVLIQARLMDTRRVYNRIGKLSRMDHSMILTAYIYFLQNKNMP